MLKFSLLKINYHDTLSSEKLLIKPSKRAVESFNDLGMDPFKEIIS